MEGAMAVVAICREVERVSTTAVVDGRRGEPGRRGIEGRGRRGRRGDEVCSGRAAHRAEMGRPAMAAKGCRTGRANVAMAGMSESDNDRRGVRCRDVMSRVTRSTGGQRSTGASPECLLLLVDEAVIDNKGGVG